MENLKMKINGLDQKIYQKIPWAFPPVVKNFYLTNRYIHSYKRKRPHIVFIEPTNACNLNCVMCPTQRKNAKKNNPDGFMSIELFRRIVDQMASEYPTINLWLHKDGEPLLHPNIVELIEYASSKLPNVHLSTNATLLNKDMTEAILNTNLRSIRFSIDGSKSVFEKIRVQSKDNPYASPKIAVDYDSVIANVLYFCEKKRELRKGIRTGVCMTDFKPTAEDQKSYRSFWNRHVDYVRIARFSPGQESYIKRKKK